MQDTRTLEWEREGKYFRYGDMRIFFRDSGGEGPVLVYLHGYPSCSYDLLRTWDLLSRGYRLIVHDHPGFGLSDKPANYSYSLIEQAEAALALYEDLGLRHVHLVAHDYGTSVATEILSRLERGYDRLDLKSLTLCNGSVHIEMADLRWIQRLLKNKVTGPWVGRLSNRIVYLHQLRRLWYDRRVFNEEEWTVCWEMMKGGKGMSKIHRVSSYIDERYKFRDRWVGALNRLQIPVHILWAQNDPVSVKEIGERLYREIPGAVISRMEHCGHYPMVEQPEKWAARVLGFLDGLYVN